MIGYGRGGGGGFGGFPYRSSHQQGQDGRGRGGAGRGRGRRQKRPQKRSDGDVSYQAELQVPPNRRGRIVGRGGATLGRLREETGARIFVPPLRRRQRRQSDEDDGPAHEPGTSDNDDVHPVRVNASGLPDLLHAFYEIRTLLSRDENADASISCLVKMRANRGRGTDNRDGTEVRVDGLLIVSSASSSNAAADASESLLFRGTAASLSQHENDSANASSIEASIDAQPRKQLLAYAVESPLSEDDVATAVDNLRFVNASDVEGCQWFYRRPISRNGVEGEATAPRGGVVFVFGAEGSNPQTICRAIKEAMIGGRLKACVGVGPEQG